MATFPSGLSSIEFNPFFVRDRARDDGGNVWETEDADPYWLGTGTTGQLDPDKLQDWEGFVHEAVRLRSSIEFLDPVYWIPAAYRFSGLPGGFSGTGALVNMTDAAAPKVSGFPIGLVLKRGDRVQIKNTGNGKSTYHMVSANTTVASTSNQSLPLVPATLPNVLVAGGADVIVLNPVAMLNIVPNTWRAARRARQNPTGSFQVEEASVT